MMKNFIHLLLISTQFNNKTTMKLFITLILYLFSLSAYSLPDEFNVYVPNSGVKNTTCRALFDLYANRYNASPVYVTKEGAGGMLAMLAMLENKKFSVSCSGPSETVFNTKLYPGHEKEHKELSTITIITTGPTAFYTSYNSKFNDIKDLMKSGKPITVGHHTVANKMITQLVFGDYPITWVPFMSPGASLPSLIDGSLDLYVDTGSLETMVSYGKLKSLGHLNGPNTLNGPNITKDFAAAAAFPSFISVTTSVNNNQEDIEEMNRRLIPLINTREMINTLSLIGWSPLGLSVKASNDVINHIRIEADRLENVK